MPLYSPKEVAQLLKRYHIQPKKNLGQNFLVDGNIVRKILEIADIRPGDRILEVGPGLGTMTVEMASQGGCVIAIEIDPDLNKILAETMSPYKNVKLIHEDAMQLDYNTLEEKFPCLDQNTEDHPVKVVANLPYNIAAPLVVKLATSALPLEKLVLMVQKEVARRFAAKPNTKDYGAISVLLQYYFIIEEAFTVSPKVFYPQPRVDSAVLRLLNQESPPVHVDDEKKFFQFIRRAFNQRRKTLVNNILPLYKGNKQELMQTLEQNNFSPRIRGESLTLEEFAQIFKILYNNIYEAG